MYNVLLLREETWKLNYKRFDDNIILRFERRIYAGLIFNRVICEHTGYTRIITISC